MSDDVTYTRDYWRHNPDAPFYWLMRTLNGFVHPHADLYDELVEEVKHTDQVEWLQRFKDDLRAALLDPSQIPHPEALITAAEYDDGNDLGFLRRLWRDLYPDEPVPGGG